MNDFDAVLAHHRGERAVHRRNRCTECKKLIPETDDCIEWADGSGFICEKCADKNEAA